MKPSRYNTWVEHSGRWFVHNGVSGSILEVSDSDRAALAGVTVDARELSAAVTSDLAMGRMVVPDHLDERDALRGRYMRSRGDRSILNLTVVTSLGCNFACPYCFEDKHPSILGAEVEDAIVQVVDNQIEQLEQLSVTWFGGEPLVGKRPLLRLSDVFIDMTQEAGVDYRANMITNGFLLDEPTCSALAERQVSSVQIGLDGPPDVHNKYRPLASGGPTFWRIVENLHHAVEYFDVSVRVNVDRSNFDRAVELLDVLEVEGLRGRMGVYVAQLIGSATGGCGPNSTYENPFLTNTEFAEFAIEFAREIDRRGFGAPNVPRPTGTPCVAVRQNSLVVGSAGELYKCWDSVGNPADVIGDIREHGDSTSGAGRWLRYDPFSDAECLECIALPVCMGGCAHYALDESLRDDRCGTFRTTHHEQVRDLVAAASVGAGQPNAVGRAVPVSIGSKP